MKEILRHSDVSFDDDTLTKLEGMRMYIHATKGAHLEDVRLLRHTFKIPVDMMIGLTRLQAVMLLDQLKKRGKEGLLSDIPVRYTFIIKKLSSPMLVNLN